MVDIEYAKAYTEVLEILSHLSQEEYAKIPLEKIRFYKKNMDKNYSFKIDPKKDLAEQNISKKANAIIINLYRDYFATEEQNQKIKEILYCNQKKIEQEKSEKYNPDAIFKNKVTGNKKEDKVINNSNLPVKVKDNIFLVKVINYIKVIFAKFK